MEPRTTLADILSSCPDRHVTGKGPVWRIEGSSREVQACKSRLLEWICRDAMPFVHYDEPPDDVRGLERAEQIGSCVWQLPQGASGSAILQWLYLGNWQLYVRSEPLSEIPDLCRSSDVDVAEFVKRSKVGVIIDSFHDDVSWVIGLQQ